MYRKIFKRLLDIALSTGAMIILSPLFIIIALAVKLDSPGPAIFRQKRVGIHKTNFNIMKFRTMRIDTPCDKPTHLLENPERYITKVGRFLRRSSLDELPQIVQVFSGLMSIVGPRPALWNQSDLIEEREKYITNGISVNDLRPGLTGWAQVNGRDELGIYEKAKLDGEYLRNVGVLLDCRCFWMTVVKVFKKDGIVEGGTGKLKKEKEVSENTDTVNI